MKDKLLLHACCGPCSTAIIEAFHNYYNITLYYYNPCITNEKEYNRRADELKRFVEETGYDVNVVIAKFNPEEFYDMAKGLEEVFEGGFRCKLCYIQRLEGTALYAKENGFNYFSTTLTISPYKDSSVVNSCGTHVGQMHKIFYMPFDFSYLYVRSLELCEQYDLYQQNYCGCPFSKNANS